MSNTIRLPGRIALMVAHCAGMVDLIALPVWVGTLIAHYKLDPQQAGGLVTLFLVGAVVSSLFFSSRFNRMSGRAAATIGFGLAALAFFVLSAVENYVAMAVLHAVAGVAVGCGLSFTHGTIGRSARPHQLFAIVGISLGVFAILFFGATPKLVEAFGGPTLFYVFGGVMAVATLVCGVAFPRVEPLEQKVNTGKPVSLPSAVWFCIAGVTLMSLVQAMTFSFVERMGSDRGFGVDAITGVLIALGIVNLMPSALAVALERRLSAPTVLLVGPFMQAIIALLITQSSTFIPYATGAVVFTAVIIFTQPFAFGLLARLDPSGRAAASTPAMLMLGSAIGPILGGTLVKLQGYGSLGIAAVVIAVIAMGCFRQTRMSTRPVIV